LERHLAAKLGTVIIPYWAGTISHQAAVHPKYTLGALTMQEEEEEEGSHIHQPVTKKYKYKCSICYEMYCRKISQDE